MPMVEINHQTKEAVNFAREVGDQITSILMTTNGSEQTHVAAIEAYRDIMTGVGRTDINHNTFTQEMPPMASQTAVITPAEEAP